MTGSVRYMMGVVVLLLLPVSASMAERLAVQRMEDGRLYDAMGDVYHLAGVRLVEQAEEPAVHAAMQEFIDGVIGGADVRFEASPFEMSGMTKNRYGDRIGVILYGENRWLEEELILRGYAVWSGRAGYPDDLRRRLVAAERMAILEKAGLWRMRTVLDSNNPPKQYWKGQFVIARGVVRDVHKTSARTYLNFGEDWKTDFTAAIPSSVRRKFESGGWKLSELSNKSILIRGFVRFYNGPYLELDFPEQMEIEGTANDE